MRSGAALATVVGVLVEVPVMLSLVAMVNAWRPAQSNFRPPMSLHHHLSQPPLRHVAQHLGHDSAKRGRAPASSEYLHTPPSRAELKALLQHGHDCTVPRKNYALCSAGFRQPSMRRMNIARFCGAAAPIFVPDRPIVVTALGVRLYLPPSGPSWTSLPNAQIGLFTEDGEVVDARNTTPFNPT